MIFGSVCSGIEAASVAFEPLGWKAAFFSEIEKFPSAVLAHHYPDVPNLGDMTKFNEWGDFHGTIDLLCGGTPCQSFSVAGLRKGLDDARGNLMLTFGEMAAKFRPPWILWENVPGVLSSGKGRDFGAFLGLLAGRTISPPVGGWGRGGVIPGHHSAYGLAYRVFDAQYFRVAQRRRRVFVVGYLGDWRPAAAVLFERESLRGHPAPRRESGKGIAGRAAHGAGGGSHWDGQAHPSLSQSHNTGGIGQSNQEIFSQRGAGLVPHRGLPDVAGCLQERDAKGADSDTKPGHRYQVAGLGVADVCGTLSDGAHNGGGLNGQDAYTGRILPVQTVHGTQDPDVRDDQAHTLGRNSGQENAVCIPLDLRNSGRDPEKHDEQNRQGVGIGKEGDPSHTLSTAFVPGVAAFAQNQVGEVRTADVTNTLNFNSNASGRNTAMAMIGMAVRRLTPTECERLQGFPDGYTKIPYGKKPADDCPDGPRYKALGNSWAVPNVAWIGRRIDAVNKILKGEK